MRVALPVLAAPAVAAATFLIARAFGVFFVFLPLVFVPFAWRGRSRA